MSQATGFSVRDVQILRMAARACADYEDKWDWTEKNVPEELRDLARRIREQLPVKEQ